MNIKIFDAHCDTIQKICDSGKELLNNDCHLMLEKMRENKHIQVFATFIDKEADLLLPFERCNQLIDYYFNELDKNSDKISHCETVDEIDDACTEGKIAALLSIEGGEALSGKLENVDYFYKRGVRLLTLCWNYDNEICGSIASEENSGLTDFGKNVLERMNSLGMVTDLSHSSEKTFWDVMELSKKPVVASHSNVFELRKHKRNLKESQIRALIENGGCIGINFYSEFLAEGKSKISDILKHIEYILAFGGENNIGLGSDFDGMTELPEEINGIWDIEKIPEELLKIGYSEELVQKIAYRNFLRVFNENFQ